MKTVAAGVFKVQCLAIMDEVQARRETVVITKHGRAVAKLVPAGRMDDDIFHFLCDKGSIHGDVVAPALSREEWGDLQ
jgi:antitoxin (DNA-binding transcriptional repressor) of toxin-antitoxin stability system